MKEWVNLNKLEVLSDNLLNLEFLEGFNEPIIKTIITLVMKVLKYNLTTTYRLCLYSFTVHVVHRETAATYIRSWLLHVF